jgi:hypothetical protein
MLSGDLSSVAQLAVNNVVLRTCQRRHALDVVFVNLHLGYCD